jgi:prospero homeobox 1
LLFQVPDHYLPVVEITLREFFAAIRGGRDVEPSWKKQIYKIIARYDEPIPDYFKTQDFLHQLE